MGGWDADEPGEQNQTWWATHLPCTLEELLTSYGPLCAVLQTYCLLSLALHSLLWEVGKEVWMIFLLGSWDSVILVYCPLCCTENKAGDFHFDFLASPSRRQLGLPFPTSWGLKQHLAHCRGDLMLTSPRCHVKDTSIPPESRGWGSWSAVPIAPVDAIQISWNHVMGVFVRQKLSAGYEVSLKV